MRLVLGFSDDALLIDADGRRIRVTTETGAAVEGEHFVTEQTPEKARPGNLVTWAVDRVRAFAVVRQRPHASRQSHRIYGARLARARSACSRERRRRPTSAWPKSFANLVDTTPVEYTDPETGWPPPPMQPMLSPALEGEGKWVLLDKDPFVLKNPGAAAPFVLSFMRIDRKRAYAQTYI